MIIVSFFVVIYFVFFCLRQGSLFKFGAQFSRVGTFPYYRNYLISLEIMSENNNNSQSDNYSASQPTPEIFSDATSRFLNNNLESPTKTYSASQPEPAGNGGILKKSRKSLGNGRRVSFAATAHVRVFGNEEKAAEEEAERRRRLQEAEEAEEQRQLELFRKQFDENNDNNVDYIKDSLNEFEIKSSPLVSSTEQRSTDTMTPSKRPFTNVDQSFDGKIL